MEREKQAIIGFHLKNPLEGYRRLTFMMLDADMWRSARPAYGECSARPVSCQVELEDIEDRHGLRAAAGNISALGHRCLLNIGGTFYYLCSALDGLSRFIVNWKIRESMTEPDIEMMQLTFPSG